MTMEFAPGELKVSIRDFGKGMPQAKKDDSKGLGLIAMRERAELLNGKLQITTSSEAGTTISISMPLKQEYFTSEDTGEPEDNKRQEVLSRQHE